MQFPPDTAYPDASDTVQAVTSAVSHVAMALDELKDQLEIANRRVSEVAATQTTEAELGRLFVRAAQFADSAIAEAQDEARRLVADARREADRIVADARGHADAIIEEAERSTTLPSAFALQVQTALDGFTHVNREFMKELEFLWDSLQTALPPAATSGGEIHRPPEVAAVTMPSLPTESGWRPQVPEVTASTSVDPDANSLDGLLASAWRPTPEASPQPNPPLWQPRANGRE
jgi:DivIVA protein